MIVRALNLLPKCLWICLALAVTSLTSIRSVLGESNPSLSRECKESARTHPDKVAEFRVLISTFYSFDTTIVPTVSAGLLEQLRLTFSDLREEASHSPGRADFEIITAPCTLKTHDEAREAIELFNADMVVWGRYSQYIPGASRTTISIGNISTGRQSTISIGNLATGAPPSRVTTITVVPHATIKASYTLSRKGFGLTGRPLSIDNFAQLDYVSLTQGGSTKLLRLLDANHLQKGGDHAGAARVFNEILTSLDGTPGLAAIEVMAASEYSGAKAPEVAIRHATHALASGELIDEVKLLAFVPIMVSCMELKEPRCSIGPYAENAKAFLQHLVLRTPRDFDGHLVIALTEWLFEMTALTSKSYAAIDFFASDALSHAREAQKLCELSSQVKEKDCESVRLLAKLIIPIVIYNATLVALASGNTDIDLKWVHIAAEMPADIDKTWAWLRLSARITLKEFKIASLQDAVTPDEVTALSEQDRILVRYYVLLHQLARVDEERMLALYPVAVSIVLGIPIGTDATADGHRIVAGIAGSVGFWPFSSKYVLGTRVSWSNARLATLEMILQRSFQIHGPWDAMVECSLGGGGRSRLDSPMLGLGMRFSVRFYRTTRVDVGVQLIEIPGVARLVSFPMGISF